MNSVTDFPPITRRAVLALTIPIILSNLAAPIGAAIITAVLGQLGDAAVLGGAGICIEIFALLFWSFGFLRMSTSGLTAQARGAGDANEIAAILERALLVAVVLGLALILLQVPIGTAMLWVFGASAPVQKAAWTLYAWQVWSAPFVFVNYAVTGWLIGLAQTGRAMALFFVLTVVEVTLSLLFVLDLNWGIAGAGAAVLIGHVIASMAGLVLAFLEIRARGGRAQTAAVFAAAPLWRLFSINSDIMIRTLCLECAFATLAALGARNGDVALAANGILLGLFAIAVNIVDGFANSVETFTGQAVGAKRRDRMMEAVWLTSQAAGIVAAFASVSLWLFGGYAIDIMTTAPAVRDAARQFLPWCALTPVVGFAAFQLDGMFIGATRGRDMRNLMIICLAVFWTSAAILVPILGNHGVWLALLIFFAARGITYAYRFPALMRDAFAYESGSRG